MKKVCVIGSNLYELSDTILSLVKSKPGFYNKIVVPDKFSLLAELGYFKNSNKSCTFDTEVISISKLAYHLLEKVGVEVNVISSQQQALLVKKAIQNCKDSLSVIKCNASSGFYNELSKTISQLKSSKVDLRQCNDINLAKINDFKLIICEYEKLLAGKQDNNDLLTILEQNFDKFDFLKNTSFYFVGFDSFTTQAFDIIKQISQFCDICVGALVPPNQDLKSIYDLDIYNKLQQFDGLEYLMANKTLNFNQSIIENNLFSQKRNVLKTENNFLNINLANSLEEEIEFVFNSISNKITKGEKAGNFNLAVADIDSCYDILQEKAELYNLPVFIDHSLVLTNTNLYRFAENIFNFILSGFSKEHLINFWLSDFVKLDTLEKSDIINCINELSLFEKNFFKLEKYLSNNAKKYYEKLINFIKNTKKCVKIQDFYLNLLNLLENFECENELIDICNNFKINKDIKNEKLYLQVYEKFVCCVEQIKDVLFDSDFSLSEFSDDFKCLCENVKISTVPISSNCVYIADATDNFFAKANHLFIIGAGGEALPKTVYDCSLILDEDIQNVKELKNVSPTINMINKRNKFKVYNLCLSACESLNICYSLSESGKDIPCYFVSELMEIFNTKQVLNISQFFDFVDSQSQIDYVLKNLINTSCATKAFFKMTNKSYSDKVVCNSLYNVLKEQISTYLNFLNYDNNKQNIQNACLLFFGEGKTKITQIEDYFNCPYLHFLRHGLKLKENKSYQIDARDIGNVLHYVAENFLKQSQDKINKQNIPCFLDECFENISVLDKFKKFSLNQANSLILKFLKDESFDLCMALLEHKTQSDFNNYLTEYSFVEKICDLQLKGFIDRLDMCKTTDQNGKQIKLYRIIDYKSGNPSITSKDIYCGLQIQPAVYGAIIKKKLGDCSGIFLMPLKNQKSKDNFKLKGFYKKDVNIVRKMENTLSFDNPNGKLINAKLSVKKENLQKGIYELSSSSGTENFNQMLDYSFALAQSAIQNIKAGHINCLPCNDKCQNCPYLSICNFDKLYKNINRDLDFDVNEQSFDFE